MMMVEKTAKTVDEAVQLALDELKVSKDKVEIEVLEQPAKGIFGIIGSKHAKVRVTVKEIKEKNNVKPDRTDRLEGFNKLDELEKKLSSIEKPEARPETRKEKAGTKAGGMNKEMDQARKFLRDVLNAMDIKAEIRVKENEEGLYINLAGPKMGMVIGRRGQTLDSLQYLVSLVVNKDSEKENYVKVILDTEDYRRKREETLNRLAKRLAEKVIKSGKNVELEPMNPYERRIIHSALQDYANITTYSEGEEPFRKVIISHK